MTRTCSAHGFLLATPKQAVAACRAASGSPIVVGGAGYGIFPESALAYLGVDCGIRGEGEAAFPALLSWRKHGRRAAPPPSTYFANGSHTAAEFAPDLDRFPLLEARVRLDFAESTTMRIPVQSRRGCPLDRIYCSTSLFEGRPVRRRSPQSLVKWLAALRQDGFRHFDFVDNTFNQPSSYAKELCRMTCFCPAFISPRLFGTGCPNAWRNGNGCVWLKLNCKIAFTSTPQLRRPLVQL